MSQSPQTECYVSSQLSESSSPGIKADETSTLLNSEDGLSFVCIKLLVDRQQGMILKLALPNAFPELAQRIFDGFDLQETCVCGHGFSRENYFHGSLLLIR